MNLDKELITAKNLAIKAGLQILQIYDQDFPVEYKDGHFPLTEADKRSNTVIINGLKREFSTHALLSEESNDDLSRLNNDWCWIIDPLDGTKEFIKKNGEFTVNIALAYRKKVVLGVVYAPVLKQLYYAVSGQGSFLDTNGKISRLKVSNHTDHLILAASRSHASDQVKKLIENKKINQVMSIGSSLKGCLVACGKADLYYRFGPTMEWDTAAMHCIAEEAGAVFKQLDDSQLLYNRTNSKNEKGFYILNRIENKFSLNK